MATEQFGDIVIAPRVLEKIIAIATAKVEEFTLLKIRACQIAFQNAHLVVASTFIQKKTVRSQWIFISTLNMEWRYHL